MSAKGFERCLIATEMSFVKVTNPRFSRKKLGHLYRQSCSSMTLEEQPVLLDQRVTKRRKGFMFHYTMVVMGQDFVLVSYLSKQMVFKPFEKRISGQTPACKLVDKKVWLPYHATPLLK